MAHSPSKYTLSINTRQSFVMKQSGAHASFTAASAFNAMTNTQTSRPNISEFGLLPRQAILAKNLNPTERIFTLEKKMMKILLHVIVFKMRTIKKLEYFRRVKRAITCGKSPKK